MKIINKQQIVVAASTEADVAEAKNLALQLQLPFVTQPGNYAWMLICEGDILSLRSPIATKPFYVDFAHTAFLRRLKQATVARELLARAVGLKSGVKLSVLDGTAGWGSDSMVLAKLGAQVTALERSPIVAALLANGIQRARKIPLLKEVVLNLHLADTQDFLPTTAHDYDVIYLDPMFPASPNSALVKKPLQLLQNLVGFDEAGDVDQLIAQAFQSGYKRLVIKRPVWAKPLFKTPDFSVSSGSIRFDVSCQLKY